MNLPDFKTFTERDEYFRDHAEHFSIVKKAGVGGYSHDISKTLEEAIALAQTKHTVGGGGYMIYACIGQQSAFVTSVPPSKPHTKERKVK
jgi:tripartite-type tricarboxylate transporter receptor subunit TctC